jgi:hypothetical protein
MMTMEEKLQTLAKAVGVNGAKYVTYCGDDYLLLPEPLPIKLPSLRFNPYIDANEANFIMEELGCSLNYDLNDYSELSTVCINMAVHSTSLSDVFFKTVVVRECDDFVSVLRKGTLDLLVEVLTTSANTVDTVQSTKP